VHQARRRYQDGLAVVVPHTSILRDAAPIAEQIRTAGRVCLWTGRNSRRADQERSALQMVR
jgi:hypothetical protein